MHNGLVKILGGKINGRAILVPEKLYDSSYVTVANETIVESSHITGHHVAYNNVTLGSIYISGILHEESYAANARVDGVIENEPC